MIGQHPPAEPDTVGRVIPLHHGSKEGPQAMRQHDPDPPPPPKRLQDLIRDRKRRLKLTWDQLVQRSVDAGHPISSSMLHHWASNNWTNIPPTEALRGLAAALGVDVDEVLASSAESLQLRMREVQVDRPTRAIIALTEGRSPEEVAALERILRAVIDEMDIRQELPSPAPEVEGEGTANNDPGAQ